MNNSYQESKRKLSELKAESNELPRALGSAAAAGNTEEVARLRQRQKELPGEIVEAELHFSSLHVARLRAEQAERLNLLEQERATSKETDELVSAELAVLDAERKRLTDEAHAALLRVHRLNGEIRQGATELHAAEQKLKGVLDRVASPFV